MASYRIGFVMEQVLGHVSYYRNLKKATEQDPLMRATWFPIPAWMDDRWSRLPVLKNNLSLVLSLRARDRLREAQGGVGFDALFFHTQTTSLCSLGLARRLPVIISLDSTPLNMDSVGEGYGHRPDGSSPLDRLKHRWYRAAFRRAAALTTFSDWTRDSLIKDYGVDARKVVTIPQGVDTGEWRPVAREDAPRATPRLLFVGGDFDRKGGNVLLEAFRVDLSGRCELDLVTGDGAEAGNGSVRFHRGLKQGDPTLRRLFDEADLFVLPTLADCSPNAIIEAMAAGLPVVATDIGAISEQVIHGETGLLVPPGDHQALARAIALLLEDPDRRRAFGAAGRRRAERLFDSRRNYRALADLLTRCITDHGRTPSGLLAPCPTPEE